MKLLFVERGAATTDQSLATETFVVSRSWSRRWITAGFRPAANQLAKLTNVTTNGSGIIPLQIEATDPPTRFFRTVQPAY